MIRVLWSSIAFALVAGLSCVVAGSPRQFRAKAGWYGETLPAGVHRGTVSGEYCHDRDQAVMVYVSKYGYDDDLGALLKELGYHGRRESQNR